LIVMPSNNTGKVVKELMKKYPNKIGQLFSPNGWRKPIHQYALDNGCFKQFNESKYFKMLNDIRDKEYKPPLFVAVPDVVGCHDRTLSLWKYYYPILKPYNFQLAFVAQDGCEPRLVPDTADWIFIGGNDPWKLNNIHKYIGDRNVHVGRNNRGWMLDYCEELGVKSTDGTAWLIQRGKQYYDFIKWFEGDNQIKIFDG